MKLHPLFTLFLLIFAHSLTAMNEGPYDEIPITPRTPRYLTIEEYRKVLAKGNCTQVVRATKSLWPRRGDFGIYIEWSDSFFLMVKGVVRSSDNDGEEASNAEEYRTALHDFIYNLILQPAFNGTTSVDAVCKQIDELAGTCKRSGAQKSWDGILNISYQAPEGEEFPNKAACSMKAAICKVRNVEPASLGIEPKNCVDISAIQKLIVWSQKQNPAADQPAHKPTPLWKKIWWAPVVAVPGIAAIVFSAWKLCCYYFPPHKEDEIHEDSEGNQTDGTSAQGDITLVDYPQPSG